MPTPCAAASTPNGCSSPGTPPAWLLVNAGRVSRHPAAPVPPDTDFIGAGDSATAGLLYALASGRPPAPEIAAAIARRLEYNRLPAL